jgi:hypothetical protein
MFLIVFCKHVFFLHYSIFMINILLYKGKVSFCHHLAPVAPRPSSVVCLPLTFHILIFFSVNLSNYFFKNTSSWLVTSLSFFAVFLLCYIHHLVMCMQLLILNVCIYLCTIVMHWFMRIKNLESWILNLETPGSEKNSF